jgi:predicted MFS family arabinose efflux permease
MFSSDIKIKLPLFAGVVIGFLGIYTAPYAIGVSVDDLGATKNAAGLLAFFCVGGIAIGSFAAGWMGKYVDGRGAMLFASGVAAMSQLLCSFPWDFAVVVALQTASNLASGLVMGVMTARIAALSNPDRSFGQSFAFMSIVFAVLLYCIPYFLQKWGGRSLFLILAGVTAAFSAALLLLQDRANPDSERPVDRVFMDSKQKRMIALLFLSMTITFASNGGIYSFSERIALNLKMSSALTGTTLAASTISAVLGASLAGWIGGRGGRTIPFAGSILLSAISFVLILDASVPFEFVVGMVLYGLVSMFFTSYAYGTAAALDTTGRTASALQGYSLLPYALGPGLLAAMSEGSGYSGLAWPVLGVNIVAIALLLPVVCGLDGQAGSSRRSPRGSRPTR